MIADLMWHEYQKNSGFFAIESLVIEARGLLTSLPGELSLLCPR